MDPISRRSLFAGACAVVALGGSEVPAAANAAVKKLPNGKLSVTLKNLPALSEVGGAMRIGSIKGVPIGVARVATNKYTAFNLRCPHQGITVARTDSGWMCRAHNSEFEADGDLVLGPATTGLASVPIKVSRGVATIG
jgi:Rieske Fe-S protein